MLEKEIELVDSFIGSRHDGEPDEVLHAWVKIVAALKNNAANSQPTGASTTICPYTKDARPCALRNI